MEKNFYPAKHYQSKWWQVAVLSIIVSAFGSLSAITNKKNKTKIYTENLKQASWGPPSWVFAPAWTVNNFLLLLALQHLLHSNTFEKKKLLFLQAMIWTIFFSFNYVYFKKKSSMLAAIWTLSDAAFAGSSFLIARKENKKLSNYYLPLFAWTLFAGSVAIYQALKNPDPVFKTKAFLD